MKKFNLHNEEGNYRIFMEDGQVWRQYESDDELFEILPELVSLDEELTNEEKKELFGFYW